MSANPKSLLPSVLVLIAALAALAAALFSWMGATAGAGQGSRAETVRESVAALEARGLWREAIDELDSLRRESGLPRPDQADALYKMGMMADLYLNDCGRALGYYTQAKALNPQAKWAEEADKRAVVCLENTGRGDRAQALLNQLTEGEGAPGGTVVAVIDGRSITWEQVQSALFLATKPADLNDPAARSRMLQEYVFTTLLAAEAVKKGYDRDPAVNPAAEHSRRQTIAALFLRRELGDSPKPEEQSALAQELIKQHAVRTFNDAIPKP